MTAPRFDALAGRLLERARSGGVRPPHAEDRQNAISVIEQAIRRKRRRMLASRSLLAAAAVAILGLGLGRLALHHGPVLAAHGAASPPPQAITVVGHPTGSGATVVETGSPSPLTDGRSLVAGSRILARPDGHVVLSVSTGTRLTVEEGGDLSIVESGADEVFAVRAGAVRADVAKLHAGQRFVIRTPDAEVEVRGTSFRVAVAEADSACGGGTVTRVSVFEGVVSVRHAGNEARIAAGQSWPSECTARSNSGAPHAARGHAIALAPRSTPPESSPASAELEQSASDLREQNDAFARAFAAKRRGAVRDSIDGFEAFVARYPSSSLVESALVQRMRLLQGVDPRRAVKAAEQYLTRYPKGFARAEAEAIERQAP